MGFPTTGSTGFAIASMDMPVKIAPIIITTNNLEIFFNKTFTPRSAHIDKKYIYFEAPPGIVNIA